MLLEIIQSQNIPPNKSSQKLSTDRGTEESVGEEQLVVWVAGLGGDAQVEEADPSLQLAGEVHGLRR